MENNYYQIYVDAVLQLAQSLVIKSTDTAAAINRQLLITRGPQAVDAFDSASWKYYRNVAGLYHETDEMMTVVSMDTLEVIDFTQDNLAIHRGTAKAYAYGSTPYKELVNRYPNQERLILGILYPADLTEAINAAEGQILSYPPHLVEPNEYTLIQQLQQWIFSHLARWDNVQFKDTDNLYATTMLGVMYAQLVPAIMMIRQRACKTNEVHSYHLRQYLASHGLLDAYLDYMTRHQALFLYRNIAYIERNSGKQAVFEWLTEHIMTHRGLPLAEYEMRHNLQNQPGELTPLIDFYKRPLNTQFNHDLKDIFTLDQVLDKEDPLARDNLKYRDDEQAETIRKMKYSLSNRLDTKLLESSIIDYAGSEWITLADVLLYHWLYLSSTNHYRAYVGFTNPSTGEFMALTAKEAFEFYTYLHAKRMGIELVTLPAVIAQRVIRVPKATLADVMSVVNPKVVPASFGQQMLNLMPVPQAMISVDSFYEYCYDLHQNALAQYKLVCAEEFSNARGQKHGLMNRCWSDVGVQLGEAGQTYDEWFAVRNIRIEDYSPEDMAAVETALIEEATGVASSKAITLKDIQQAMVKIMGQLGSYSVQYVATINSGPIIDAPCATMRPDDMKGSASSKVFVHVPIEVINSKVKMTHAVSLDIGSSSFDQQVSASRSQDVALELTVRPVIEPLGITLKRNIHTGARVSYDVGPLPDNPRNITPVLGLERFLLLSLDEQLTLPDLWH